MEEEKLDLLFKKIAYTKSRTTAETNPFEESYPSVDSVIPSQIWTESEEIPSDLTSLTALPEIIQFKDKFKLHKISGGKAYLATKEESGDFNNLEKAWVSPKFGTSYSVNVFSSSSSGYSILGMETNYYFDYSSGVLHFLDGTARTEEHLYLDGYLYVGESGSLGQGLPLHGTVSTGSMAYFMPMEDEVYIAGAPTISYIYENDSPNSGSLLLKGSIKGETTTLSGQTVYPKIFVGEVSTYPSASVILKDRQNLIQLQSANFSGSFYDNAVSHVTASNNGFIKEFYYDIDGTRYYATLKTRSLEPGFNVTLVLPHDFDDDLSNFAISFDVSTTDSPIVRVNSQLQNSGVTTNNFSTQVVKYVATTNGGEQTYYVSVVKQNLTNSPQGDYRYDSSLLTFSKQRMSYSNEVETNAGITTNNIFSVRVVNERPIIGIGNENERFDYPAGFISFMNDQDPNYGFFSSTLLTGSSNTSVLRHPFITDRHRTIVSYGDGYYKTIGGLTASSLWDDTHDSEKYLLAVGDHRINHTSSIAVVGKDESTIVFANSIPDLNPADSDNKRRAEIGIIKQVTGSDYYQNFEILSSDKIILKPGQYPLRSVGEPRGSDINEIIASGSLLITEDLKILGKMLVEELQVTSKSVTHLDASGSTRLGDSPDDTHSFVGTSFFSGSVTYSGSNSQLGSVNRDYSFGGTKRMTEEFYYLDNYNMTGDPNNSVELDSEKLDANHIYEYEFLFYPSGNNTGVHKIFTTVIVSSNLADSTMLETSRIEDKPAQQINGFVELFLDDSDGQIKIKSYYNGPVFAYNLDYNVFAKKKKYKLN